MIDERLPDEWPSSIAEAMRHWRQGYVVEDPPFFYYRSDEAPIWRMEFDTDAGPSAESLVELNPSDAFRYGLITTQTCDLVEEGRPKQPWIAVAPVYDIAESLGPGQLTQLQRGYFGHLILLTAGWLPDGQWVADLRIEMPVEKGWLTSRTPRQGFASQADYDRLASRLASRRGRPALSTALTESLTRPLRDWLHGAGKATRDRLDSLRLRVVGDPLTSTQAELLVISNDEGLAPDLQETWMTFEAERLEAAADDGVILAPFRYGTLDAFSARDVETSIRLDYDHLSPD